MSVTPPALSQPLAGIVLKVSSVTVFVVMQVFLKAAGQLPPGQIVFYRSFFAILPILVMLTWQGELSTAFRTSRPFGHLFRGVMGVMAMGFGFYALTRLPLPEAIVLNYAQPLAVVLISALFLGETVRIYRWTAVVVGLVGVLIVSWPKLTLFTSGGVESEQAFGVAAALVAALMSAVAMLQIRNLVATERSSTIVLWFSLSSSVAALCSLPFGWAPLEWWQVGLLVSGGICGGIGQILMTEAYRHASVATVAPFEYTSILVGIGLGYLVFADIPTMHALVGGAIIVGSGLFIVWREQRLGLERARTGKIAPPS